MTLKTDFSRFQIHDELTAPDASARLLQGMTSAGGSVSKFVGMLAGAPAALRAFARMRHELRGGVLPAATRERIALAVAEDRGDAYSIAQHARQPAAPGWDSTRSRGPEAGSSTDPREAALLTFLKAVFEVEGTLPIICSKRPARSIGATRRSSRRWPTWR